MMLNKPFSDLDQIKASEALRQKTMNYVKKRPRVSRSVYAGLGLAAAFCVCLLLIAVPAAKNRPEQQLPVSPSIYSYVTFDINPSIELRFDQDDQIVGETAYNAEGRLILDQLDLSDHSLEECIRALAANETFQTYMENGYLQVSVYSEDTVHSAELETKIDAVLSDHYSPEQYGCSCASEEDHSQASSHHLSAGRYQIIDLIRAADPSLSIDELKDKSMKELKVIAEQLTGSDLQESHHRSHHGR